MNTLAECAACRKPVSEKAVSQDLGVRHWPGANGAGIGAIVVFMVPLLTGSLVSESTGGTSCRCNTATA